MSMLRNMPRPLAGALILLLGIAQPALAEVFCVATAVGLQNALIRAAANGQDDEVRIVQGTYVGNFVYASTEAQALSVLGGYTVGCASRTINPANTVFDGNQTGTVLKLLASTVAAEFVVEGLTLRKGGNGGLRAEVGPSGEVLVDNNFISGNTSTDGGGVYLSATTVTFTNNDISGNTASYSFPSNSGGYGGGVYLKATTTTLTNNDISGNISSYGSGGVYLVTTTATLANNNISGNSGGGVYLSATTATLTNNDISGNTSRVTYYSSNPSHGGYGGGVYLFATTATLANNDISDNTVSGYSCYGGGVYITGITATLNNNGISGNTASCSHPSYPGSGGGVYLSATTATLTNNDISWNSSSEDVGGGVYLSAMNATLTNNDISGNTALYGGGLYVVFPGSEPQRSVALFNNLFWLNHATADQGADFQIYNTTAAQVTLLANNFDWTTKTGFWVGTPVYIDSSNLDKLDPRFVDARTGDHHLQPGSPMIDAGYPKTPNLPATDLGGGPRVLGAAVDIGAYEFNNGSGKPDLVVTSLVLTPATPFATTLFNAKVTVKNQGTLAAKPGTLQVWTHNPNQPTCGAVGNKSATWATNLAPGASIALNISGLAAGSAGAKTFRAFIDSQCATAESNETNNQLTKAYTVKPAAPDFRVTSMVLTPTSPKAYGTFKAVVTVKNFGTVGGNGGYLDVWNHLGAVATCGTDGSAWAPVGTLAAGASKAFTFTGLRSGAKGAKTLRAFVDSYCQSTETSETNNQAAKAYTVLP